MTALFVGSLGPLLLRISFLRVTHLSTALLFWGSHVAQVGSKLGEELGILSLSLWRHCDYMTGPCGLHHPVLGDARDEMQGFWYTRGFLPTEQCLQQTRFIWKTNKERLTKQKVGKAAQCVGLLNEHTRNPQFGS